MKPEIEAKFLLSESKDDFRKRLQDSGAKLITKERQMIRHHFVKDKNPGMTCDYIRVRQEGDKVTFSAKQHLSADGDIKDNKELVVEVSDFETTVHILQTAGLIATNIQETLRESWMLDGAQIEIDTWPSLDPYVEIEADSEERVKNTAEALAFEWKNRIITSVEDIFMEKYGLERDEVRSRLSYSTFDKPPFADVI